MKLEDVVNQMKHPSQMSCARDFLKEIEKTLFLLEQVDPDSLEEKKIKDSMILAISMQLPVLKAKVEVIEMYGDNYDSTNNK